MKKLFEKILCVFLRFIRFPLASCTYGVNHVLGEDFNFFFKNFDILLGELGAFSEGNSQVLSERELSHHQLLLQKNNCSTLVANRPELKNFSISNSHNDFWDQTEEEIRNKNVSKVVIINLDKLSSLASVLDQIGSVLSNTVHLQKLKVSPYFIVSWQAPLTELEEENIKRDESLSFDFQVDSDVYFSYLKCTNKSRNDEANENYQSGNNYSFSVNIPVSPSICPYSLAEIKLFEFYSVKNENFIEPVELSKGLNLVQKVIRRNKFRALPLPIVAMHGYPFRAKFSENNSSLESGYEADQIAFLGESFNLSIIVGIGAGWLTMVNDTVGGMGTQITSGEAEISISASEMLPYRAKHVQFLHPTYYTKLWGFFIQPPSSSFRDIFIHAFTKDLWLTMLSTWSLIVLAMLALSIVKRRLNTMHENDVVLMQELYIWAAGAICQQGWHCSPHSTCMKIVFIFALITGLVSYVAYSAALVSILSMKVVPIRNLDDIIDHGYHIYNDNQTIHSVFVMQKLERDGFIPTCMSNSRSLRSEAALPKVLGGSTAFIGASDFFYPIAKEVMNDTLICNSISQIPISQRPVKGGMFLLKGSPFKDFFNHRLLIMQERGLRFRLLETYFRQSGVLCLEKTGATKDPLGFNDVYTAFVILLLGYCVSLLILMIERCWPPVHFVQDEFFDARLCLKIMERLLGSAFGKRFSHSRK